MDATLGKETLELGIVSMKVQAYVIKPIFVQVNVDVAVIWNKVEVICLISVFSPIVVLPVTAMEAPAELELPRVLETTRLTSSLVVSKTLLGRLSFGSEVTKF